MLPDVESERKIGQCPRDNVFKEKCDKKRDSFHAEHNTDWASFDS